MWGASRLLSEQSRALGGPLTPIPHIIKREPASKQVRNIFVFRRASAALKDMGGGLRLAGATTGMNRADESKGDPIVL
jgi:hypothetical protein